MTALFCLDCFFIERKKCKGVPYLSLPHGEKFTLPLPFLGEQPQIRVAARPLQKPGNEEHLVKTAIGKALVAGGHRDKQRIFN